MPLKQVIALGTYHEAQHIGHALNAKFAGVISLVRESYGAQIILEEWLYSEERSFASTLSTSDLEWKNVGTPEETRFETSVSGLNCHPPTHDPAKPILQEYGPLAAQERREGYMVARDCESPRRRHGNRRDAQRRSEALGTRDEAELGVSPRGLMAP